MPDLKSRISNGFPTRGYWTELIGTQSEFTLETRVFHSISLGMIFLLAAYVPYNLYAGLYVSSLSALGFCGAFFYQYFYSRFRGRKYNSTLFGLSGLVVFGLNYFTNAGIQGSTDLIWPAYLLLVLAISPYRQHVAWFLLYLITFFILHLVEYYYPELVMYPFSPGSGQFMDRLTAFPMPVVAVFIIIRFLRRSYDKERKIAEEKTIALELNKGQILQQKDQLEQSNVVKSKLMSIVSHDLRTPLINIQSYLELLNAHEIDSAERPELENALLKSTSGALDMLSNLLHWSKSQMEGLSVNFQTLTLQEVLSSTIEMQKMQAAKKDISLYVEISEELTVVADPDMLQLVLRNLISNAVKFTPKGGSIHVVAQKVNGECKVTVTDSGYGIPEDKQKKIFSIKSEAALGTDNERGVGLGLVLCKEFIERQGGKIGFDSKAGECCSFFIYLPSGPI